MNHSTLRGIDIKHTWITHTSRNWSPCQAPYQTHMNHNTLRVPDHLVEHHIKHMNHNTLRAIDHLVEHHIKHTWITAHFAKLITLSSTILNTHESQHTWKLITLSSTRSNTHESQHISRNWSPCRSPYQTHMNHNTLREIDHLVEHQIKHTWITAHLAKLITWIHCSQMDINSQFTSTWSTSQHFHHLNAQRHSITWISNAIGWTMKICLTNRSKPDKMAKIHFRTFQQHKTFWYTHLESLKKPQSRRKCEI